MPARSIYHTRQVRPCPYCGKPRARYITQTGRNKGFYKTCKSRECWFISVNLPSVIAKKRHVGPNHPRYIIDRTQVKNRPRTEQRWWREAVFERDNYTCQICGVRGGKLQADHILAYSQFPELRWDLTNGRTLCVNCHKTTPNFAWKSRVDIRQPNQ